jgi:hypothetical protein
MPRWKQLFLSHTPHINISKNGATLKPQPQFLSPHRNSSSPLHFKTCFPTNSSGRCSFPKPFSSMLKRLRRVLIGTWAPVLRRILLLEGITRGFWNFRRGASRGYKYSFQSNALLANSDWRSTQWKVSEVDRPFALARRDRILRVKEEKENGYRRRLSLKGSISSFWKSRGKVVSTTMESEEWFWKLDG